MTLNDHQTIVQHPRLNMVASGIPLRYLGIHLGHQLDPQRQLNTISDAFYTTFVEWGCRARTLKGRRLLVNTMILSKLWHYTAVLPVPRDLVSKWQTMVANIYWVVECDKTINTLHQQIMGWHTTKSLDFVSLTLHHKFEPSDCNAYNYWRLPMHPRKNCGLYCRRYYWTDALDRTVEYAHGICYATLRAFEQNS